MNEEVIFQVAADMPAPERAAYLLTACEGQPALRQRIERLLASHDDGGFMQRSADRNDSAELQAELARLKPEEGEDRIGNFKLLQKIGEGGFGTVWMADQLEPVRRRVALKIIKPGMDTKEVLVRFEQERQALALMDHPNIAKVIDAGVTPLGRPFFVMELVRGIRITDFCDQNNLPTAERLALFIAVCHAIQHAHQKGIIHRDIKPSNILVTLHDGVPVPKVIDFGVAKAMQSQRLTELTFFTRFEQMIGTPLYMSPEQAEMSGLDIDTRSDIYSLGVLLYELLTGTTPFDAKELMALGIDAMRKTIRETEPVRPSTRLTKELVAVDVRRLSSKSEIRNPKSEIDGASSRRLLQIKELVHQIKGDLDWIVMKCLEKDRTRRYDTANGLASDIQRHLNDEAVLARPPSAAYRVQKLVRRNKLMVAAVGGVACALVLGLVVSTWQAVRATNAEQAEKAQAEQARADRDRAVLAEGDSRTQAGAAKDAWATTRRNAYAAEINVAFQALAENNLARAIDLLNRQRPKPGEEDLRGFEWRHLWQLCQSDAKVTFRDVDARHPAFSPDGRWLAYGGNRIVIRELPSQAVVKTISIAATTLAFSPDGKLLATGHDSHVRLWSTESWEEVQSLPDARYPTVFSRDGQWLVTGAVGGYRVWSTRTWQPAGFCAGEPHAAGFARETEFLFQSYYGVAFSPDGRLLVTAGHTGGYDAGQFQVWDFPSLTLRTNFSSMASELRSAVFTPDSKYLLVGDQFGKLMVWDVAEGRVVETLDKHTGGISTITFARDGRTMATSSGDRTLVVWDWETRKPLVRLRGHLEEISSSAISPDGRMLASGSSEGTISLWDTSTRRERRVLPECGMITGFSADGRWLVVRGYKDSRLWRLEDGAVTTIPLDNFVNRRLTAWTDVHGIEPYAVFGMTNGVLEHWNLATMSRVASWRVSETGVSTAAFSGDGRLIAISDVNGRLKLWEAATHREIRQFHTLGEKLECMTFSPDGRLLAGMIDNDKPRVCIWDVNEGSLRLELKGYDRLRPSLSFSPDGKLLATGYMNNTARLWEIPSGNLKATLRGHIASVFGVAFSPDGKTLATGSYDRKVKLWNIATEQEVATLELLPGSCVSLRFSPDGRTLAAGSFLNLEPYISLWQAPSFEEIDAAEANQKREIKQP